MSNTMEERGSIPVGPPVSNPLPSYWHNPKSPLANLVEPEPDNTDQIYDHVIIGSGISGTMIAYNLLNTVPTSRIVMLEAREACGGATGRNGGHTKAASYRTYVQHREELGVEEAIKIARLEFANIQETHKLASDLGIDCENKACPTVDLIYDQETFKEGESAIETLGKDAKPEELEGGAMACYRIYDKASAMDRFFANARNKNPVMNGEEELAGAFEYAAGRINAYRFTTGILKECVKKGLRLCTNTPVHDVLPADEAPDGESLFRVFTQYNTVRARSVVYATNGYTPYLLSNLQGAIVPLRGQVTAQKPGKASTLPTPLPTTYSFIYKHGYEYMIPRPLIEGGQHIVIGGGLCRLPEAGAKEYGTVDDSALNPEVSAYLKGTLVGFFGEQNWGEESDEEKERIVQEWTGIMGATADGRPYVGPVPGKKGMWISAGFNGHGMVLCLKSAEALVHMMNESDSDALSWFPQSFLISEDRLARCKFRGRTDMRVPETKGGAVELGKVEVG